MFLIKILANDKTEQLHIDLRYEDIEATLINKEEVAKIVEILDNINQPITMNLNTILQLVCQYADRTDIVEYLLEANADPKQEDASGWNAYHYLSVNKNKEMRCAIWKLLDHYEPLFPDADKTLGQFLGWKFLQHSYNLLHPTEATTACLKKELEHLDAI